MKFKLQHICIPVFILLFVNSLFAYRPLVLNYSYNDYKGHQTNYDALFDKNGILYVANAYGLLEFDGVTWQKISLPNSKSPLSLSLSDNGKIFVGAHEDLGYIEVDSSGKKLYHSLRSLIKTEKVGRSNFTVSKGSKTYFVTYENIYVYDGKSIVAIAATKGNFFFHISVVGDEVWVMESNKGLAKITDNKLVYLDVPGFEWHEVRGVLKLNKNEFLIYRQWDVVVMKDGVINQVPSLQSLFGLDISDVVFTEKGQVVSTQGSGIYFIDQNFNITDHYSEDDGIKNVFINAIAVNKKNDVCVATLNGISLIRQNKEKIFYDKKHGVIGLGYSSALCRDTLYVGTSQGLFYLPNWSRNRNGIFQKAQGTKNFVYDIFEIGGHIFCGDQSDVYEIVKGVAQKISPVSWQGSWKFVKVNGRQDLFMVGTYHGIDIYRKMNGKWQYSNKVIGFDESSRQFEMDKSGRIWVSQGINGMFCLEVDKELSKVLKKRDICKELKVSRDYFNDVVSINGELKISSFGGMYSVNEQNIVKDNQFSKHSKDPDFIRSISGKILYSVENGHPKILKKQGGFYVLDKEHQLNNISLDLIGSAEHINELGDGYFLAGSPDGLTLSMPVYESNFSGKVLIRSFTSLGEEPLSFYPVSNNLRDYKIPYSNNSLRFYFTSSPFEKTEEVVWYYMLEEDGKHEEWKSIGSSNYHELIDLEPGNYTFSVKALSFNKELGISIISFSILPPWYRTTLAYLVYFTFVLVTAYIIFLIVSKRFEKSRLELIQQKEKELKTQNEEFEKEKLQMLLQEKENALSSLASNFAQKKEFINQMKGNIERMIGDVDNDELKNKLRGLSNSVDLSDEEQANWENFQGHANQEYNNLFEKIKKLDPNINESHLMLCSYIRMGKSNKEMATLLSVSLSTIDKRKSRLRQKFGVPEEQNIVEFIRSL